MHLRFRVTASSDWPAPRRTLLQRSGELLAGRRLGAALNRRGDVLQFRRPQAELDSDFRLHRTVEKLSTMLCTLAVFFRGLHGFPHIFLSVETSAQMCRGPVCHHPPPAPLGGMLDTRPTPVWPTSTSAVC